MAFVFPDDKATFTAPNGITYAWKDDHWVVQKFMGDHEVYVSPIPPEDPEEGKLWYDSSDDVIELFIYVDGAWVSATPSSEYALESRIAANEDGIRDLWTDQQRQDLQTGALENRVDALEGVVGEFTYTFQTANQTPREGQLSMLKADMSTTTRWAEAESLIFNPTSLSGDTFDQSEIVTGDVIRLHVQGDITMQVSAFEAKVIQNGNGMLTIDQKVKTVGTGMDNTTYEVFHLSSFDPSGLATMHYVDAQDAALQSQIDDKVNASEIEDKFVEKAGSDMDNNAYINFPGGGIHFKKADGEKKSYFYNASENITQWSAYNGSQLKVTARDGDPGGGRTYIDIRTSNSAGTEGEDSGYRMRLFHVATPTEAHHGANKKYVDEQVEQIQSPDIIIPGDSPKRPPGLRFQYESGSGSVSSGKFKWYDSSGRRLRISATSYDFPWGTDSPIGDINYSESHLFHIYATVTDSNTGEERWRIKVSGSFNRMDWHADDVLIYVPYNLTNGSFSETAMYYITVSGLF